MYFALSDVCARHVKVNKLEAGGFAEQTLGFTLGTQIMTVNKTPMNGQGGKRFVGLFTAIPPGATVLISFAPAATVPQPPPRQCGTGAVHEERTPSRAPPVNTVTTGGLWQSHTVAQSMAAIREDQAGKRGLDAGMSRWEKNLLASAEHKLRKLAYEQFKLAGALSKSNTADGLRESIAQGALRHWERDNAWPHWDGSGARVNGEDTTLGNVGWESTFEQAGGKYRCKTCRTFIKGIRDKNNTPQINNQGMRDHFDTKHDKAQPLQPRRALQGGAAKELMLIQETWAKPSGNGRSTKAPTKRQPSTLTVSNADMLKLNRDRISDNFTVRTKSPKQTLKISPTALSGGSKANVL